MRAIHEMLSIHGKIENVEYTWSNLLGDTQCVGIAYICSIQETEEGDIVLPEEYGEYKWVTRDMY